MQTQYCANLHTIDKIISFEGTTYSDSTFRYSPKLANIIFEGTIAKDINFIDNPLTHDSLMSIINALKDFSGTTTTKTLSLHADAKARLSEAEIAIATQKGWSLL